MGTIDLSGLMRLSGKIGPVVAYVTKGGKQVFRAYVEPRNPRTPKQMAQRAKFALVTKSLSPLNKAIRRGHPGNENAYRSIVSTAFHEAVTGDYPDLSFDYGKVQIAAGRLQLPTGIRLRADPLSHTVSFSWNPQPAWPSLPGSDNDKVYITCFNTDKPSEVQMLNRGIRAAGKASVELPEEWQPATTHFWIYLTSHDLRDNSDSIYLACNPSPDADNPPNATKT